MAHAGKWHELAQSWSHSEAMKNCIQDPVFHAEGDVWRHTQMVFDQVKHLGLGVEHEIAALYHDVAKPQTRCLIQGEHRVQVSHPKHSRLGAQILWKELYQQGAISLQQMRMAYWLCRWHQAIFHVWKQQDMMRAALTMQADIDLKSLIDFAVCDSRGRICENNDQTVDLLLLLHEWYQEQDLSQTLVNPISRKYYFEKEDRSHTYEARVPQGSRAIVLCGLPGSGKDTWIKNTYPDHVEISLDKIRHSMNIHHGDNQGMAIQAAQEMARTALRKGQPLVWNSTNLTRQMRQKVINLMRDYDAHVTINVLATSWKLSIHRNQTRQAQVPQAAIERMLEKWEPPSNLEAHNVEWIE